MNDIERTQEAHDRRAAEYARLEQAIESAIGQERHYGIRVWSEHNPDRPWERWFVTDPRRGLERYAFAHYGDTPPPVQVYTREQYERACAAVGIAPAPDDDLGTYADKFFSPDLWDLYPFQMAESVLRRRRLAGLEREAPTTPTELEPATSAPGRPAPAGVADRQATRVADLLGLPTPPATGNCHYCGQPLDRSGECEECS